MTDGTYLPYNPKLKERARELRKHMTECEKILWYQYLKKLPQNWLRQKPIDNYIVDFYCPVFKLVIEVDGESHFTEEGKIYDEERTMILSNYGLKIIRFPNTDVKYKLHEVCKDIECNLH
ncbi:MAG TPA: endonuclease domain-containing protein [Bacillota bacterium]|nr:endonuclease domain-containing protein [Bacillota bacterium]